MNDSELQEYWDQMRADPRSIKELVSTALTEVDEDVAWNAVCALHFRGNSEVLKRARELCQSVRAPERRLGANILGQLGVPERTFPKECLSVLLQMLDNEEDAEVLSAILIAFGHLHEVEAIEPASHFRGHPDPKVRDGTVFALMGHENQKAIDSLMELSQDEDVHVRDWATFALGSQIELDTPAIRDALAARLEDTDEDTRHEAITGLANRKDRRVTPAISKELASDPVDPSMIEAAAAIADPQLYPQLVALQESKSVASEILAAALTACSPSRVP